MKLNRSWIIILPTNVPHFCGSHGDWRVPASQNSDDHIEVLEVEVYTGVLFASYDPVSRKIAVTWTEVCFQTWFLQLWSIQHWMDRYHV